MARKINRFQAGGAMTPLAYYLPDNMPVSQNSGSVKTSSSETKKDGNEKQNYAMTKAELMKGLANILPSDMSIIKDEANSLMNLIDLNDELDGMFMSEVNQKMLDLQMKINIGQQAKTDFDKSIEQITSNKSQDEIALDQYGRAMMLNKDGSIRKISLDEANPKMRNELLTYGDISNMRKLIPKFAYNEDILTVMRQSASMDDIMKDIHDVVSKIGHVSNQTSFFAKKQNDYITKGIESIVKDGEDGIYKIDDTTDVSTREQKMFAIDTIISNMSVNKRNALMMRAKMNGTTPEAIVYKAIAMADKPKYTRSISYTKFNKDDSSSNEGGSGTAKSDITTARAIQEMYGDIVTFDTTNGHDNNFANQLTATAVKINAPIDEQGLTNLSKIKDTNANGAIDWQNASIAGQHIDETRLNEFVTSNTAYVMYMPYKLDGTGRVVVDFSSLDQIKPANDFIKNKYGMVTPENYQQVNKDMVDNKFNILFDANGNPRNANIRKFVAFNVNAGYNTFNKLNLEDSPHVYITEGNATAEKIAKSTGVKATDSYLGINPMSWFTEDKSGSAVVYFPTYSSAVNASIGAPKQGLKEDLGVNAGQIDKALQEHKQKPKFQKPNIEIE